MRTQQIEEKRTRNELKLRVSKVVSFFREKAPEMSLVKLFLKKHPSYDTRRGFVLLQNVKSGRTANEDITIKLEALMDEIKNS